jgi:hypothetical protein
MGLGWSLFGLDMIAIAYIAVLVSKHGSWGDILAELPPKPRPNADLEKTPNPSAAP